MHLTDVPVEVTHHLLAGLDGIYCQEKEHTARSGRVGQSSLIMTPKDVHDSKLVTITSCYQQGAI